MSNESKTQFNTTLLQNIHKIIERNEELEKVIADKNLTISNQFNELVKQKTELETKFIHLKQEYEDLSMKYKLLAEDARINYDHFLDNGLIEANIRLTEENIRLKEENTKLSRINRNFQERKKYNYKEDDELKEIHEEFKKVFPDMMFPFSMNHHSKEQNAEIRKVLMNDTLMKIFEETFKKVLETKQIKTDTPANHLEDAMKIWSILETVTDDNESEPKPELKPEPTPEPKPTPKENENDPLIKTFDEFSKRILEKATVDYKKSEENLQHVFSNMMSMLSPHKPKEPEPEPKHEIDLETHINNVMKSFLTD